MRRIALAGLALLWAPALAHGLALYPQYEGHWVSTQAESEVVWDLDGEGRLRLDGRPADYAIRGDTLVVRFDPPVGEPNAAPEVAVYRFIASVPQKGQARMFVYGFDLGKEGIHLVRTADQGLTEDAAPPAPPAPPTPPSAPAPPAAPEKPSTAPNPSPSGGR